MIFYAFIKYRNKGKHMALLDDKLETFVTVCETKNFT